MAGPVAPMLAIGSTGSSGRAPYTVEGIMATGDWVLDLKLDGERAIVHDGRIFNRKGADVTHVWPDVLDTFPHAGTFDGEIVTLDGKFETTLLRSSQSAPHAIRRLADKHPARFVAFDLPLHTGIWTERRWTLLQLYEAGTLTITPVTHDDALWASTRELGMEGVIAKRCASKYRPGKRSLDWVKFKHLHRVSCVAYGYEPGNGHRERFGAMKIALIDQAGEATPIGRVGSGFTERDITALKNLLDAGQMPVVEIECTHVTSGGVLRFPVYRGQRLDVALTDCTTSQLDTIPKTG